MVCALIFIFFSLLYGVIIFACNIFSVTQLKKKIIIEREIRKYVGNTLMKLTISGDI